MALSQEQIRHFANSSAWDMDASRRQYLQQPLKLPPDPQRRIRCLTGDWFLGAGLGNRIAEPGLVVALRQSDAAIAVGLKRAEFI